MYRSTSSVLLYYLSKVRIQNFFYTTLSRTLRKRNTPFCRFGDMPVIKVTYDFLAYG